LTFDIDLTLTLTFKIGYLSKDVCIDQNYACTKFGALGQLVTIWPFFGHKLCAYAYLKPRSHCHDFRPDSPRLIVDALIVASRDHKATMSHSYVYLRLFARRHYECQRPLYDLEVDSSRLHQDMLRSATTSYDLVRFYYARIRNTLRQQTTTDDY